ncbi:hypothetical protein [Caloranaerobacter sp. DY30410]|uniref:hypothetical protein n=1 Tax=Caloranaerobacter sp. DY30410 TaxID=3238305 RepID=UPI003CFE5114
MKKIVKKSEIAKLEQVFNGIFQSKDPFGEMFQEKMENRMILCPTEGYYLTKKQFSALIDTLESMENQEIVITVTETEEKKFWVCNNRLNYSEYLQLPLYLENAIYSSKGEWGILVSHEEHAVVGGIIQFMSKFKNMYSEWEEDIKNFKEMWKYNHNKYKADLEWMNRFKKHMNIDL